MSHHQQGRTLQHQRTALPPDAVLTAAREFFARRSGIYAAFLEKEGPTWMNLRGQGGEEIVIAAITESGATAVTASSYLFDAQVAQFLTSLPPVESTVASPAEVA